MEHMIPLPELETEQFHADLEILPEGDFKAKYAHCSVASTPEVDAIFAQ